MMEIVADASSDPAPAKHRASHRSREEYDVEFARIVAFSDGVFAIAITLLVLSLEVPPHLHGHDLTKAILDQGPSFFAYGVSFAVIGRFWVVHHRFFAEVTGFDSGLLALNLFYLAWIVLIPFSSALLGDHNGTTQADVVYALNLAVATLVGGAMFGYAHREKLIRPSFAAEYPSGFRSRALLNASVFLASIPVAYVAPHYAPYVWVLLFFVRPGRRSGDAQAA